MDIFIEKPDGERINKQPANKTTDELTAQMAKEAIENDEDLAPVADQINVKVRDGAVTVEGQVNTSKQSHKASATAQALGDVDEVKNCIEVVKKDS